MLNPFSDRRQGYVRVGVSGGQNRGKVLMDQQEKQNWKPMKRKAEGMIKQTFVINRHTSVFPC
jgi:hypothetical protein